MSVEQAYAPALTPELWAKVFPHLEEVPESIGPGDDTVQNQPEVHQLKLVCKQFRDIHASHSDVVQHVYLGGGFSVRRLPSLLAWLQQSQRSVKVFQSNCNSQLVDDVLAALASFKQSVKMVKLRHDITSSIFIVAKFINLEKCSLWHSGLAEGLDLTPLALLPKLSYLALEGNFIELHHLAGLTQLECMWAEVLGVQDFWPTLQILTVYDSALVGIHTQGLSACRALTHLKMWNACLVKTNGQEYLDHGLSLFPANLGLLTQLHTLHLSTGGSGVEANVEWISQLTPLQDLSLAFGDMPNPNVIQYVLLLTRLTRLLLGPCQSVDELSELNIVPEWHRLQALQHFTLRACKVQLDDVAGLLQLQQLRTVSFEGNCFNNDEDCAEFACHLARLRPHVKLSL